MLVGFHLHFVCKSEQISQGIFGEETTTQGGAEVVPLRERPRDIRVLAALCASMVAMLLLVCIVTGLISITNTGSKHDFYKDKWS